MLVSKRKKSENIGPRSIGSEQLFATKQKTRNLEHLLIYWLQHVYFCERYDNQDFYAASP